MSPNPFAELGEQVGPPLRQPHGMRAVTVIGTGISHPPTVVRIADLERELTTFNPAKAKMSYEDFARKHFAANVMFTDAVERRGAAFYMAEAAQRAMERAGVDGSDIGTVVLSTCTAPDQIRGIRGDVLSLLQLFEKHTIELNGACTGFMDSLNVGNDRAHVTGDLVLVIGGDVLRSTRIDPQDYMGLALIGDGAAAAVLAPTEDGFGFKVGKTVTNADWRNDAITDAHGCFWMNAKALAERIPAAFAEQYLRGCRRNGFDSRTTVAIPHQVNGRLLETLQTTLGLPSGSFVNIFQRYGNCANASIGMALHHAFRDGLLRRGTNAVLFGAGAGFNFGYLGFTADRSLPEQTELRVLFVDDEHDLVEGMVRDMEARYRGDPDFQPLFRFTPIVEYSGEGGLRRMVEDQAINLVVTDQRMGAEMSGARMVETLKRRARDIGYILVTGFAEQERAAIERVGFSAVIEKPYDPERLWRTIKDGAAAVRNREVHLE